MRTSIVNNNHDILSLYVHIPFCEHICFYCDFPKIKKPSNREALVDYLVLLEEELKSYKDSLNKIETIYIGGGTPSSLDDDQTIQMLELFSKYLPHVKEFSIELNPESVTDSKLTIYKEHGINRLSMGIQTFDNDLLKKIGRIHDRDEAIAAYNKIRAHGFTNVSIDLMFNLFDQQKEHILKDIEYVKQLKPDHISWYSLIMKENSVWGKKQMKVPGNDELFDDIITAALEDIGYKRYEISNYALQPEFKSLHNIAYWTNKRWAGVGFGASGFEDIDLTPTLTQNTGKTTKYTKQFEPLSKEDYYFQIIMMGLRLIEGIELIDDAKLAFDYYEDKIQDAIRNKRLEIVDNHLRCRGQNINILNDILVDIL